MKRCDVHLTSRSQAVQRLVNRSPFGRSTIVTDVRDHYADRSRPLPSATEPAPRVTRPSDRGPGGPVPSSPGEAHMQQLEHIGAGLRPGVPVEHYGHGHDPDWRI